LCAHCRGCCVPLHGMLCAHCMGCCVPLHGMLCAIAWDVVCPLHGMLCAIAWDVVCPLHGMLCAIAWDVVCHCMGCCMPIAWHKTKIPFVPSPCWHYCIPFLHASDQTLKKTAKWSTYKMGQIHIIIRIYGVHKVLLAWKSPYIRSCTVRIYDSGPP